MGQAKIGDVLEIQTTQGLAYALYTHKHKNFGALLRVFGSIFPSRLSHFESMIQGCPLFETFFPLSAALHKGAVSIVGNVTIPPRLRDFPMFRDGISDPSTGSVKTWWLWDGEREWPIGNLTEEQRRFPIREVINDTLLRERIESGWTPEREL
jgi:hypothetical protein